MEEGNENEKKFYNKLFQDLQNASSAYSKILILYDKFRFTSKKDLNAFFNAATLFIHELNKNISAILQFLNYGYYLTGDENLHNIIQLISQKTRIINKKYNILKEGIIELNDSKNNETNLEQTINYIYKISIIYKISQISYKIMQLIGEGIKLNGQIMAKLFENPEKYELQINKILNKIIDNKDNNKNTTQ